MPLALVHLSLLDIQKKKYKPVLFKNIQIDAIFSTTR